MRHDDATSPRWPWLFRLGPAWVVALVAAFLVVVWSAIVLVDVVLQPGGIILWMHLFNDRPVEWVQWLLLAATAVCAGHLAARLPAGEAERFFVLFAVGVCLMLFEDAGDARHVISDYLVDALGGRVWGVRTRMISDLVYFAVIASVPVYALLRYGHAVWRTRRARGYLVGGYGLYAVASVGSAFSGTGLYEAIGRAVDHGLFAGRLSKPADQSESWAHFFIADSPVEETIETLAAVLMLAMVLAYADAFRATPAAAKHTPTGATATTPAPGSRAPGPDRSEP